MRTLILALPFASDTVGLFPPQQHLNPACQFSRALFMLVSSRCCCCCHHRCRRRCCFCCCRCCRRCCRCCRCCAAAAAPVVASCCCAAASAPLPAPAVAGDAARLASVWLCRCHMQVLDCWTASHWLLGLPHPPFLLPLPLHLQLLGISWTIGPFVATFLLLPPVHHLMLQAPALALLMRRNRSGAE